MVVYKIMKLKSQMNINIVNSEKWSNLTNG